MELTPRTHSFIQRDYK